MGKRDLPDIIPAACPLPSEENPDPVPGFMASLDPGVKSLLDMEAEYYRRAVSAPSSLRMHARPAFVGLWTEEPISPGARSFVITVPQVIFRATRLVVSPRIAPFFNLLDLRVGKNSMFINTSKVTADAFPPIPKLKADADPREISEWVRAQFIDCDTAHPGMQIGLHVENNDRSDFHDFRAVLWGSALWE